MKLSLLILAALTACSNGFVVLKTTTTTSTTRTASSETSSSLEMNGFLDGRGKNNIMKEEDEAMWVDDDDDSGWNPFVNKKAQPVPVAKPVAAPKMQNPFAPKKKVEVPIKEAPKKVLGGFKFPWDK